MKYEALRRVKQVNKGNKSRKVKLPKMPEFYSCFDDIPKDLPKEKEIVSMIGGFAVVDKGCCIGCGCLLNPSNRADLAHMCKNCFMVEMAENEAADEREDSMSDDERMDEFLGK
jgi:hypothetical protein